MKGNRLPLKKKFYLRIYLLTTLVFLFMMSLFAYMVYHRTHGIVQTTQKEYNEIILINTGNQLDIKDEEFRNLCLYIYSASDVNWIMNLNDESNYAELLYHFNRIKNQVKVINSNVHSFYIYNGNLNKFYSSFASIDFQDEDLKKILKSGASAPKLKPIYRKIKNPDFYNEEYTNVFTYIMYSSMDKDGNMDGAVVLNIKASWINSSSIIAASSSEEGDFVKKFIYDSTDTLINPDNSEVENKFAPYIKSQLPKMLNSHGNSSNNGSYTFDFEREQFLLSYWTSPKTGFKLIKLQPYDQVFKYLNNFTSFMILITLIFIIVGILMSFPLSSSIYRPLNQLLDRLGKYNNHTGRNTNKDELGWLENTYNEIYHRMNEYQSNFYSNKNILREFSLSKIMIDSSSLSLEEITASIGYKKDGADFQKPILLCVIRIDNYDDFKNNFTLADQELNKFALINIVCEILQPILTCEGVDMKDDTIVLLCNESDKESFNFESLKELLRKAREIYENLFQINFSTAIASKFVSYSSISESYNDTYTLSKYRYIYGSGSVIDESMVASNLANTSVSYAPSNERKLIEAIKTSKDYSIVQGCINNIFDEIAELSYEKMMISITKLITAVNKVVEEIHTLGFNSFDFNLYGLISDLSEIETLEGAKIRVLEALSEIATNSEIEKNTYRNDAIADKIKEIIKNNYTDSSLCLSQLAAQFKMSNKIISKLFKDSTGISINNYINNIRLEMSAKLLESSEMKINRIYISVGFENESTFYRQFKIKYGVTPNDYAVKKALEK